MDACVVEILVVLMRRYMSLERQALIVGSHAHVVVFQSLVYLYGMAMFGLCSRTRVLGDDEMPDLEPTLQKLPRSMQEVIRRAIAAERSGRCVHEQPTRWGLNFLESRYIWAYEEGPSAN